MSMFWMSNSSLSNSMLPEYICLSSPFSHSPDVVCTQSKSVAGGTAWSHCSFVDAPLSA